MVPSKHRVLSQSGACDLIAASFVGHEPTDPTSREMNGVEMEWITSPRGHPRARSSEEALRYATSRRAPARGRITVEPGGQIELSTRAVTSVDETLDALGQERRWLAEVLSTRGIVTCSAAIDLNRAPSRVVHAPRYDAMEEFFGGAGTVGQWMMTNTASLQINLAHDCRRWDRRWTLLHRLAPLLIGLFARSPAADADGRWWFSMRQAVIWAIGTGRTGPPDLGLPAVAAWQKYVLDADVMMIRARGSGMSALRPGFPFRRWLQEGHELGWPTPVDLAHHMTTLFPPIRPRGWLELRFLDSQPPPRDEIVVMLVHSLLVDGVVDELAERIPDTAEFWMEATRSGLSHPVLRQGAEILLRVVAGQGGSVTSVGSRRERFEGFVERRLFDLDRPEAPSLTGPVRPRLC